MASLKKNAFYNLLLAGSQVVFPLITFPYISRILQPEGLGAVTFVDSYTQYFLLLAALGIPVYGVREIAKYQNNPERRQLVFSELLGIHFITSLLISIVYIASFLLIPSLFPYRQLFWVGTVLIFGNTFVVEWLYQGMEAFPFLALRTIAIRSLAIVLIFLFVRSSSDLYVFYSINCMAVITSALVNLIYARKYVHIALRLKGFIRHIKPMLFIFSTGIITSVYTLLDGVMLGFISGDESVAFYATGVKINKVLITVLSALSAVLIPALSFAFKNKEEARVKYLLQKSFHSVCLLGVPMAAGILVVAEPLTFLFAGERYGPTVTVLQLLAPTILFIGISYVFGMQILNPTGNEKLFFRSALVGMCLSLVLNLALIPSLAQVGAAVANLLVELIVMCLLVVYGLKKFNFNPKWNLLLKAVLACVPFYAIAILNRSYFDSSIGFFMATTLFSVIAYSLIQALVWRDDLLLEWSGRMFLRKR